ncbi:MAG: outer membrane beta-barrel protein [Marinilabiliaceae bacterium]|nr:outer membrane beta-barrel protein [Marinilabiliaceae bacterium]
MKRIIFLFVLLYVTNSLFAQPNSGFKGGVNLTWFQTDNAYRKCYPALGYHLGYAWRINCSPKVSISIESMFNRKSIQERSYLRYNEKINGEYVLGSKMRNYANYVSAPLGVNYMLNHRFYVSGGYEFSYCLYELFGDQFGPAYDHAGYLGGGFHSRYFDVVLRYAQTFNEGEGSFNDYHISGKSSTLQLSLILSLGRKKNKED